MDEAVTRCAACGKPALGKVAKLGDAIYHADCLACAACSVKISGSCVQTSYGLICQACAESTKEKMQELDELVSKRDYERATTLVKELKVLGVSIPPSLEEELKAESVDAVQKIKHQFDAMDMNGDGFLYEQDFSRVLTKVGMPPQDLPQLFKEADGNKDGKIDYEEFLNWLYKPMNPDILRRFALTLATSPTRSATSKFQTPLDLLSFHWNCQSGDAPQMSLPLVKGGNGGAIKFVPIAGASEADAIKVKTEGLTIDKASSELKRMTGVKAEVTSEIVAARGQVSDAESAIDIARNSRKAGIEARDALLAAASGKEEQLVSLPDGTTGKIIGKDAQMIKLPGSGGQIMWGDDEDVYWASPEGFPQVVFTKTGAAIVRVADGPERAQKQTNGDWILTRPGGNRVQFTSDAPVGVGTLIRHDAEEMQVHIGADGVCAEQCVDGSFIALMTDGVFAKTSSGLEWAFRDNSLFLLKRSVPAETAPGESKDPTAQSQLRLIGSITSAGKNPESLSGVQVDLSMLGRELAIASTNAEGKFDATLFRPIGETAPIVLNFKKVGFVPVAKTIPAANQHPGNTKGPLVVSVPTTQMLSLGKSTPIKALEGGVVTDKDSGCRVKVPANAFVNKDGSIFEGAANVSMKVLEVSSSNPESVLAMPGGFTAVDSDGRSVEIETLSAAYVGLTDEGGSELQLGPDKQLEIEVETDVAADVDGISAMPSVWMLDSERGSWIEAPEVPTKTVTFTSVFKGVDLPESLEVQDDVKAALTTNLSEMYGAQPHQISLSLSAGSIRAEAKISGAVKEIDPAAALEKAATTDGSALNFALVRAGAGSQGVTVTTTGYQAVATSAAKLQIEGQDIPRVAASELSGVSAMLESLKELAPAIEGLNSLSKADIAEVKHFKKPPAAVVEVLRLCICILDGSDPMKQDWKACQNLLNDVRFLSRCCDLSPKDVKRLDVAKKYIEDRPHLSFEAVRNISLAAAGLIAWASCMVQVAEKMTNGTAAPALQRALELVQAGRRRPITLFVPQPGWWNVDMPYRTVCLTGRLMLGRERIGPIRVDAVGIGYRAFTQARLSAGLNFKIIARANSQVSLKVAYLEFPADDRLSLVKMTEPIDVLAFDVLCPGAQHYLTLGPFTTPRVDPLTTSQTMLPILEVSPEVALGDLEIR